MLPFAFCLLPFAFLPFAFCLLSCFAFCSCDGSVRLCDVSRTLECGSAPPQMATRRRANKDCMRGGICQLSRTHPYNTQSEAVATTYACIEKKQNHSIIAAIITERRSICMFRNVHTDILEMVLELFLDLLKPCFRHSCRLAELQHGDCVTCIFRFLEHLRSALNDGALPSNNRRRSLSRWTSCLTGGNLSLTAATPNSANCFACFTASFYSTEHG